MKKLILFIVVASFVSLNVLAQAPIGFNYQGLARDNAGVALANTTIKIRIAILGMTGSAEYEEIHSVTTNQFGLFGLEIGRSQDRTGQFQNVDWGNGSKSLKIEIDPKGGTDYSTPNITPLLSVPYALYSSKSGSSDESQWKNNASGIHYNIGNVGIGNSSPTQKLDVNGKVRIADLGLNNAIDKILVADVDGVIAYREVSSIIGLVNSPWTVDAFGVNYPSKVSIGNATGEALFQIVRNAAGADRNFLRIQNISNQQDAAVISSFVAGSGTNASALEITVNAKSLASSLGNAGYGIVKSEKLALVSQGQSASADGYMTFITGGVAAIDQAGIERMRIDHLGNVGIGISLPKARLHVSTGDVYLDDPSKGVIMKDASDKCWRLQVKTDGGLTTTSIPCP